MDWGNVEKEDAIAALHTALNKDNNLFDTADVYGDGRSKKLLAQLKCEQSKVPAQLGSRVRFQKAD